MKTKVKLMLCQDQVIAGPGTIKLLRETDACNSVRIACEHTTISYSKGWKLIKKAEKELGVCLVRREAGGKNGGYSCLTEEGKKLVGLYEELEKRVNAAAEAELEKMLAELVDRNQQ